MKNTSDLIPQLFEQFKIHSKLVSAGVDTRTACEMTLGEKNSDEIFKELAKIAGEKYQPNIKNN